MLKTPPSHGSHIHFIKDILSCYRENHPEKLEAYTNFIDDIHTLIADYKELLDMLAEHDRKQSLLILYLANGTKN